MSEFEWVMLSAMPNHPQVTTERIEIVLAMFDAYLKKGKS